MPSSSRASSLIISRDQGGSKDQVHLHVADVGYHGQARLDVVDQHRAHAAARRGQRHDHAHRAVGADPAIVDEAQVEDVDRYFRVEDAGQGLFDLGRVDAAVSGRLELEHLRRKAQRIGVGAVDTRHVAVEDDGIGAPERLGQRDEGAGRNRHRIARRHQPGIHRAADGQDPPFHDSRPAAVDGEALAATAVG